MYGLCLIYLIELSTICEILPILFYFAESATAAAARIKGLSAIARRHFPHARCAQPEYVATELLLQFGRLVHPPLGVAQ